MPLGVLTAILQLKDSLSPGIKAASDAFEQNARRMAKAAAAVAAAATAAFAIFMTKAAEAASRAEEVQNLFNVSFGDMADRAEDWAQRTQSAIGVNDTTLKEFSGTLFNMTTSMGLARETAFGLSTGFTQLALDTASFFNLPFERSFQVIQAGLAGEVEGLRRLGVDITEASLKQLEFVKAIEATGRELTQTEKVQARAIAIIQGLKNAQSDLARTQNSFANQTRLVSESFVNLQEVVGSFVTESQVFGSILTTITGLLNGLSGSLEHNRSQWEQLVSGAIFFFVAAIEQTLRLLGIASFEFGRFVALLGDLSLVIGALPGVSDDFGKSLRDFGQMAKDAQSGFDSMANGISDSLDRIVNKTGEQAEVTDETRQFVEEQRESLNALLEQLNQTGEGTGELTKEQIALQNQIKKTAESLGAGGLLKSTDEMIQGLQRLRQEGDVLTQQGFQSVADKLEELRENGLTSTQQFDRLLALFVTLTPKSSELAQEIDAVAQELDKVDFENAFPSGGVPGLDQSNSQLDGLIPEIGKLENALNDVNDIFFAMAGFGGELGQFFANLASSMDQARESGQLLRDSMASGDRAGMAMGAIGGIQAMDRATEGGGAGGAASGALTGAQYGMAFGPWGAAIGAGVGAIVGALRGRGERAMIRDAARDLGAEISMEMAKAIRESGRHVQLAVADIFQAGGFESVDRFAEEIGDIFSGLSRGEFSHGEAITALEESVPLLIQHFNELGPAGEEQVRRIIAAAQEMGLEFEGLQELIQVSITEETLVEMGLVGEKNIQRIREAAAELGVEFEYLMGLVQDTFAPDTMEEMAEKFGLTNDQVRELAERLGVDVQTNLERMAASLGLSVDEFKALADAVEQEFGIPAEQLAELLESMGVSAQELAEALGVDVGDLEENAQGAQDELAAGADHAERLRDALRDAAGFAGDIHFPDLPGGGGDGGGGGFAGGTPGLDFLNFGREAQTALHGTEAVIPQGSGHKLASEIARAMPRGGGGVTVHTHLHISGLLVGDADQLEPIISDATIRGIRDNPRLLAEIRDAAGS